MKKKINAVIILYYHTMRKMSYFHLICSVEILWKDIKLKLAETVRFLKISIPGNQVKLRYFTQ